MSGSHYAPEPDGKPRPVTLHGSGTVFSAENLSAAGCTVNDETTRYDLTPPAEREAQLALRVDNLTDRDEYRERRIHALEAQVKALEGVAAQHADVLQLVRLHLGI